MRKKPCNVRLVVFDLDGTLVDAYHAIADSINHMLKEMKLPPQGYRKIKRSVGFGVNNLIRHFVEEDLVEEALSVFRRHHDARLRQGVRLLPGAAALLVFLKAKGCTLAIASNRPTQFCRIILQELKVDKYFDQVICADAVARPKPHPDMLQEILAKTKIPADEAVYVGDMVVDVQCGKRAGIFMAAVPTGSCSRKEILEAGPDVLLPRLGAFKDFFEEGKL